MYFCCRILKILLLTEFNKYLKGLRVPYNIIGIYHLFFIDNGTEPLVREPNSLLAGFFLPQDKMLWRLIHLNHLNKVKVISLSESTIVTSFSLFMDYRRCYSYLVGKFSDSQSKGNEKKNGKQGNDWFTGLGQAK